MEEWAWERMCRVTNRETHITASNPMTRTATEAVTQWCWEYDEPGSGPCPGG